MSILALLFGFQGRINRGQYWLGILVNSIGFGGAYGAYTAMLGSMFTPEFMAKLEPGVPGILNALMDLSPLLLPIPVIALLSAWSNLALVAKRFHDLDRGMIWLLWFYGPIAFIIFCAVGFFFPQFVPRQVVFMWPLALLALGWICLFVGGSLAFKPGTDGPNRFDIVKPGSTSPKSGNTDWSTPARGASGSDLGGMAAAMAAVTAAARENKSPVADTRQARPHYGQPPAPQFGRLNAAPVSGGFGRR